MAMRTTAALAALASACACRAQYVTISIDADPSLPGVQAVRRIPPWISESDLDVVIHDPLGRAFRGLGFIGGIDRGLVIGHQPTGNQVGIIGLDTVRWTALGAPPVAAWVEPEGTFFNHFRGPEFQYMRAPVDPPTHLPTAPTVFLTVRARIGAARVGDSFAFHLVDGAAVNWPGQAGMFTSPNGMLDCGGDAIPDGTPTLFGVDPDPGLPSPPAAFGVDLIDGDQGSGARLVVRCGADCDTSTGPGQLDIFDFLCFQGQYAAGSAEACECDASTGVGVCDVFDFLCFQNHFARGCQ